MARLVVPASVGKGHLAADSISELPPDKYKDRLLKYIPAESVAFFAFADKVLIGYYGIDAMGTPTSRPTDFVFGILPWLFLLLGIIGTPIYLSKQRLANQPWKLHAAISTIAFIFWAYTLGGSIFVIYGLYHPLVAGIVAPLFTFVAGWFEPREI